MYNMELLSKFLTSDGGANPVARLIDFELLTDEGGKRTVGFGWYAGGKHNCLQEGRMTMHARRYMHMCSHSLLSE